jgi:hypothetical protein
MCKRTLSMPLPPNVTGCRTMTCHILSQYPRPRSAIAVHINGSAVPYDSALGMGRDPIDIRSDASDPLPWLSVV